MNTDEYRSTPARLILLALTSLALLPAAALADDDPFWTYSLRPGDTLWRFAGVHLVSPAYVPRLSALNNIRNPNRIVTATTIRVPYAWVRQQPASAQVRSINGQASIKLSGQPARPLRTNEQIPDSAELMTLAESRVVLHFIDGSELTMGSNSQLNIDQQHYYPSTGASSTRLRLRRGTASNTISKPELMRNRYEIDTPSATTSVRGTQFRVGVANDDTTTTAVLSGKVAVGVDHVSAELSPGQGAVVGKGQHLPAKAEALLPPPALAGLPARIEFSPAYFSWPPVVGARGYHVELYRADSEVLVDEADTDSPVYVPNGPLPDGSYRLKVRSRAASSLEGADAEHSVALNAHPATPLRVGATLDTFRGRTLTLTVGDNGHESTRRVQLSTSTNFDAANTLEYSLTGSDSNQVTVPHHGRWFWRVARLDANGRVGPYSSAQAVEALGWFDRPAGQSPRQIIAATVAIPGARYRLELADSASFTRVLFRQDSDSPRWRPASLPSGRYWARVSILGDNNYHSDSPPESLFWN
ncbi:FecR domain-containing protein [Neisseriaceae bacterium JH1-16]|nr:FecR domain-containing protein [Neisseriaceae bacterium JH1-16]